MKVGRPSNYNRELAEKICDAIASSTKSMQSICDAHEDFPAKAATIWKWRWRHPEFGEMYMKAKGQQTNILVEECLDIADDTSCDTVLNRDGHEVCNSEYINRSRLRVDTRKWLATKLLPRIYDKKPEDSEDSSSSLLEKILNGEITVTKK